MKANTVFRRLYRVRPLSSFVLCLPGVLLVAWYCWSAFVSFDRYRRDVEPSRPLALETLQIGLHDQLVSDLRRMSMQPPPVPSSLAVYRLDVLRDDWNALVNSATERSSRPYVPSKIETRDGPVDARIRLRGGRHWHTGSAQKSLKVKLNKGELLDGHRVFNLINDPTSMVIGEQLILDIARESGVLTPQSHFSRVVINGRDLGVFHYETAADESLLRMNQRIPGSIYSGELPGSAATAELWTTPARWTKVASRTDAESEESDFSDLSRLLDSIVKGSGRQFNDFAVHELDLTAFAKLDLLDVAFGGDQRDFRDNHKYYFDPYRGRWEPVAWNFRGFRSDPLFNLVDNPLLLRLKMTPGYLTLRDRLLYEFLSGDGSPSAVQQRATRLLTQLAPELRSDPYWDAYRQLPRVDAFHRRMVRPNTLPRLALVVESELATYRDRHAQLVRELERNPLYLSVGQSRPVEGADGAPQFATPLRLIIDGRAGVALSEIGLTFDGGCAPSLARLTRDGVSLSADGQGDQIDLDDALPLYPTISLVPRDNPNQRRGKVRASIVPVAYDLQLTTACAPVTVTARGDHLATQARVVAQPAPAELLARLPEQRLSADATPRLEAGEVAPHPWQLPAAATETVTLGPGDVVLSESRVFSERQSVTVAAGTRLLMGKDASLIFLGPVQFAGTRRERISVVPAGDDAFGGLAIQGLATAGSSLKYVTVQGGTQPRWRFVPYSGMVNVHHTDDITIEGCRFGNNRADADTVHVAYVTGLDMHDTSVLNVTQDGLDLEFSSARLRRVRLVNVGDDALDLMGSTVDMDDSLIIGSKGNGISSGEESHIDIRNTLIAKSKVGVLAKNASSVSLSGSVLYDNQTGVRTYQRTVRYAGDSEVTANVLFVAESKKKPVKRDDRSRDQLDRGRVLLDLPQPGVLDHVLTNVLELGDWQSLPQWVNDQTAKAVL